MAHTHVVQMTEAEVERIAVPILRRYLTRFGFQDVAVKEEEDFDGSYVFRMTAHVQEKVPARTLMDALGAIHGTLRKNGEERFVYLSTERPGHEEPDEDEE
jgi:hypothetical protein